MICIDMRARGRDAHDPRLSAKRTGAGVDEPAASRRHRAKRPLVRVVPSRAEQRGCDGASRRTAPGYGAGDRPEASARSSTWCRATAAPTPRERSKGPARRARTRTHGPPTTRFRRVPGPTRTTIATMSASDPDRPRDRLRGQARRRGAHRPSRRARPRPGTRRRRRLRSAWSPRPVPTSRPPQAGGQREVRSAWTESRARALTAPLASRRGRWRAVLSPRAARRAPPG